MRLLLPLGLLGLLSLAVLFIKTELSAKDDFQHVRVETQPQIQKKKNTRKQIAEYIADPLSGARIVAGGVHHNETRGGLRQKQVERREDNRT